MITVPQFGKYFSAYLRGRFLSAGEKSAVLVKCPCIVIFLQYPKENVPKTHFGKLFHRCGKELFSVTLSYALGQEIYGDYLSAFGVPFKP